MKRILLLLYAAPCCTASLAIAQTDPLRLTRPRQIKGFSSERPTLVHGGGDTFATPRRFPACPIVTSGTPATSPTTTRPAAPTPSRPTPSTRSRRPPTCAANVSLCGSGYDTVVGVYENTPATLIACDDDSPACGLQSVLSSVPLTAGNTYYIVVDGYSTACGDYLLDVEQCPPPPVCESVPRPTRSLEGEPVCCAGYVDNYNGGCNSSPVAVTHLSCAPSQTICGTYGTWNSNGTRDTDWYEIVGRHADHPRRQRHAARPDGQRARHPRQPLRAHRALRPVHAKRPVRERDVQRGRRPPRTTASLTASFFDNTPCGSTYA